MAKPSIQDRINNAFDMLAKRVWTCADCNATFATLVQLQKHCATTTHRQRAIQISPSTEEDVGIERNKVVEVIRMGNKQSQPFGPQPDTATHTNRVAIKSESSRAIYTVAQHKVTRVWSCDCPGWIIKRKDKITGKDKPRHCKHLKAMGLPTEGIPYELGGDMSKGSGRNLMDKYPKYDASEVSGNPREWAEAVAGKKRAASPKAAPKPASPLAEIEREINLDDEELI